MVRRIKVSVTRIAEEGGAIPLAAFARSLGALQRATFQIAEMLSEAASERRSGSFNKAIRGACSLQIVSLTFGSGIAELELPQSDQAAFPELDLGLQAKERLLDLSSVLSSDQCLERVLELLPADGYRRQILRTFQDICPTEDENLTVLLQDTEASNRSFRLTPKVRDLARVYAAKIAVDDLVEQRAFAGRLITLSKRDGFSFGLEQGRRRYEFPASLEQQEELMDLLRRDAWIRVDAITRVIKHNDRDDEIAELLDVDKVCEVDMSPLRVKEVVIGDRRMTLSKPIDVDPRAEGGLIVYEYLPLGIVASGSTQQEAAESFREEFSWLWEAYAEAPDDNLSLDARALKTHLQELIEGGD